MAFVTAALLAGASGCSDSGRGDFAARDPRGTANESAETAARIASRTSSKETGLLAEASPQVGAEDALFSALERMERRVAGAMARVRESVVTLEYTAADSPAGARRVATGVVISPSGEILSIRIDRPSRPSASQASSTEVPTSAAQGGRNARPKVARGGPAPIVARDSTGRRHAAAWVAADPETGLTLLRIAPNIVPPVRLASSPPKLGSSVFVVGNPYGLGHSVSRGHVAGLDRTLELGARQLGGLTQVQVSLYPGDSGATVANLRGEWLGLIRGGLAASTSSPTPSPAGRGREDDLERDAELDHDHDIGFAIPAADALWIADQLRVAGRVDRAFLGVRLETADETEGQVDGEGALLSEILAETPAAAAGLRTGDRIVALDSYPIRTSGDLTDRLDRTRAHTEIRLGVLRRRGEGQAVDRLEVSLHPASRPEAPASDAATSSPLIGSATTPDGNIDLKAPVRTASATSVTESSSGPMSSTPTSVPVRAVVSKTSATSPASEIKGQGRGPDSKATVPLRSATVATSSPTSTAISNSGPSPSSSNAGQRPLPLESQVNPPRPAELESTSPLAVIERLERIERRLERIERRENPADPSIPNGRTPANGTAKPRD